MTSEWHSSTDPNSGSSDIRRTAEPYDNQPMSGRTVLIVEDECLVGEDLADALREAGAEVIGPAETLPQAMRIVQKANVLDCALLDIDLDGVAVFPLVGELRTAGTRILFLTGLRRDSIPKEFADVACISKPTGAVRVVEELNAMLGPVPTAA